MSTKPIKRHEAIQSISREHYQGLLFGSKIRMGLKKQIEPDRMAKYAVWFYKEHLIPHFEIEEKYLFPVTAFFMLQGAAMYHGIHLFGGALH